MEFALATGSYPFNVNYGYVADELGFVLRIGRARSVVYHSAYPHAGRRVWRSPGVLRVRSLSTSTGSIRTNRCRIGCPRRDGLTRSFRCG